MSTATLDRPTRREAEADQDPAPHGLLLLQDTDAEPICASCIAEARFVAWTRDGAPARLDLLVADEPGDCTWCGGRA